MNYRRLGSTDLKVSELSFGTWAIGGSWGKTSDKEALEGLDKAIDHGVNFFDTADVYGDGHSEKLLAKATKGKKHDIYIASKFCRAGDIHDPLTYSESSVRHYLEKSLKRLNRECIDLYQIHCPPIKILQEGSVFHVLDKLQKEGKIRYYGVSVETVEEGLLCLEQQNVRALQVIFNIFRQKPAMDLFPKAIDKGVGILARVPLASGLLTGKFSEGHQFSEDDHRQFNKNGDQFNVGETFAGIPFDKGVKLSKDLMWITQKRESMATASLKWILEHHAVSAVIPGFKTADQVEKNLKAVYEKKFSQMEMSKLAEFYKRDVHDHIRGPY
ncbi:aldo/keto reductase [Salipaludibacillus sp. LMS25]|jgi:aryl-alcohol dehydrogenase-like predicted oxidoreductase|uniref:aldo/keto reductase n=1 Tax=Salipaludibacillus sp. LMS25 TaxID=2924031 RepID=UPI0020D16CB1|nr:aldo/keto reductase [Salipaludibacillus sp. LMS25]UTR14170.1 aldo/keto reductase [Salipaludibacillus sp. LMS25]